MKTLTLSITTSCGNTVQVPYTLPTTLTFDCFVPAVGIVKCDVDVSAEDIAITEVFHSDGRSAMASGWQHTEPVIEQAGAVCWVVEGTLPPPGSMPQRDNGSTAPWVRWFNERERWKGRVAPDDLAVLRHIADVAWHEQKASEAFYRLPGEVRSRRPMLSRRSEDTAPALLETFVHTILVERAQDMATKAAKARQQTWEAQHAEHLLKERCDARDEVVS